MKHHKTSLVALLLLLATFAHANDMLTLRGKVIDNRTRKDLVGATVQILSADSTFIAGALAQSEWINGNEKWQTADFTLNIPKQEGTYILRADFLGYETSYITLSLNTLGRREYNRDLPPIYMKEKAKELGEVTVSASKVTFYYKGDTVVYNADAFVVSEGSMLDAIISQMPGVELRSNGDIYHNGRKVENLLLNGKEFFRGDNRVMLDNLPSYTVKQIKVYDKLGDLSEFLGQELIGDKQYVMDVQLKKEYNVGWIANAEVGGGIADAVYTGDDPYLARLFAMRHSDRTRFTAYANVNNLNDKRKPGRSDGWSPDAMMAGIRKEATGGIDYYADDKDKKWKVNGNIQLSHTNIDEQETTSRTNFLPGGDTYERIVKASQNTALQLSTSHALNLKFSQLAMNIKPSANYQRYDNTRSTASQTFADTLINSYISKGLTRGYRLNTALSADGVLKFKGTSDFMELMASARYSNAHDEEFDRYTLKVGSDDKASQYSDRYFNNHPDHNLSYNAGVHYVTRISQQLNLTLGYDYEHSDNVRHSSLYLLDKLHNATDSTALSLGELPSMREYESTLDPRNSYTSHLVSNSHIITPMLQYFKKNERGKWNAYARFPITLSARNLAYSRGEVDTLIHHRTTLFGISGNYLTWESLDKKYKVFASYNIHSSLPDLINMIDMYDDTDPLNIKVGNSDLKNAYTHTVRIVGSKQLHEKGMVHSAQFDYKSTSNAFAVSNMYDRETGVRTSKTYNVNGNWSSDAGYGFMAMLGKNKRTIFVSTTQGTFRQSVDLVGTTAMNRLEQSTVHTMAMQEKLSLEYKREMYNIKLKANGKWSNVSSKRDGFATLNIFDVDYGVSSTMTLPYKIGLTTDFTVYTLRGYNDEMFNTDQFVWNARLTKSIMKGNLVFMLDGYDLLGSLSNITYSINAQGRTEVRRNVLPRYAMLHVQYKFNKQPKKK